MPTQSPRVGRTDSYINGLMAKEVISQGIFRLGLDCDPPRTPWLHAAQRTPATHAGCRVRLMVHGHWHADW